VWYYIGSNNRVDLAYFWYANHTSAFRKVPRILTLGRIMNKLIGLTMLLMGCAGYALAGQRIAPEIDASAGVAAVTLLSGGMVVLRSRLRRK
jgi:hypothetical protein